MKSQNLTRGWEAQRWRKTDMGNHHVNMGKILGYHHIMFILPSADVAFCYRMLSAATAHEFEPSVQHSRHPTFQPWIPVQVVIVWTSLVQSVPVRLWQCSMVTGLKRLISSMVTMSRTMQFLKTCCAWPIQGVLVLPLRPLLQQAQ